MCSIVVFVVCGLLVGYCDYVVIDGLDLLIVVGCVIVLCGLNGCGKSMLLCMLVGL